jgi:hypothetical protein
MQHDMRVYASLAPLYAGSNLSWFAILRAMEHAEDRYLVLIAEQNLIDDNIGQAVYHPFVGTGHAAGMTYPWKLGQTFCRNANTCHDLDRCDRVCDH